MEQTTSGKSPQNANETAVQLLNMIIAPFIAESIYLVSELRIADHLTHGPRAVEELASAARCDASALYRVLRALVTVGVFTETSPRVFAMTPMAEHLRSDALSAVRDFSLLNGSSWARQCWSHGLYTMQTGKPALAHALGAATVFEYLSQHPEDAKVFNDSMTGFASQTHKAAAVAYDFSPFKRIVDVGGGHGALLASILARYPRLEGVLFDQPAVIADARRTFEEAGVVERCEKVSGNFFEAVPAGGDAYVLSFVLHDWEDAEAISILKSVRRAMPSHGKLLIIESVLPADETPHFGKVLDLVLLVIVGGRERTEQEFRGLLNAAGFQLARVVPTASPTSVIEARPG